MIGKINNLLVTKIFLAVVISAVFIPALFWNIKLTLILSIALCALPIAFLLARKVNTEQFMLVCIAAYPLLPSMWGLNLGGGLPVLKAQRLLVLIILFVLVAKGELWNYLNRFVATKYFNYPILAVIFSMFISSFFSANRNGSISVLFSFVTEVVIIAVLVFNATSEKKNFNKLIDYLCYAALFLALIGIFERVTQFNPYTLFGVYDDVFERALTHQMRDGNIRIIASFPHSIALGSYYALLLPLVMYKFRNNFLKFSCSVGLLMMAILATQSRAAIMASLIIIVIYFLFVSKSYLNLLLFFAIPALVYNWDSLLHLLDALNPVSSSSEQAQMSTGARLEQFEFLSAIIKKNAIIGYGLVPPPPIWRLHAGYATTIDNYYLLYAYFYGFMGLLSYLYLMVATIKRPVQIFYREVKKNQLLFLILTSVIIFYLINIIVALKSFHFVYWVYLGLITRMMVDKVNEAQTQHNNS